MEAGAETPAGLEDVARALSEVQTQIAHGGLFAHSALSELSERLTELESIVFGIVDALVGQQLVSSAALFESAAANRNLMEERGDIPGPGALIRVDEQDDSEREPVVVDCEARIQACRAACCRLSFALSIPEVERGDLRWDLGTPYAIRHREDGYCVHNDAGSRTCTVHAKRPTVCQQYDCSNDERIWKDFDNMVPNNEWIEANLVPQPVLLRARMRRPPPPASQHGS